MGRIEQVLDAARLRRHTQQHGIASRQPSVAGRPRGRGVGAPIDRRLDLTDRRRRRLDLEQHVMARQITRMVGLGLRQPGEHRRRR